MGEGQVWWKAEIIYSLQVLKNLSNCNDFVGITNPLVRNNIERNSNKAFDWDFYVLTIFTIKNNRGKITIGVNINHCFIAQIKIHRKINY